MPAIVQVKLGDMFNGPTDLIVLPCSTDGTITSFVYERLRYYNIPLPKRNFTVGEIQFMDFPGGENVAQIIAFAASVEHNHSSEKGIQRIGEELGRYVSLNSNIQVVSAPLLGSGAGGLNTFESLVALQKGFLTTAPSTSKLVVYALHQMVFNQLKQSFYPKVAKGESRENRKPIRVFISWTRTNEAHEKWADSLYGFLKENGVNARIDVKHLKLGMDLPQFMANELQLADKVLILSNEQYAQKANGQIGGVGWETMLIQGDMLKKPSNSTRYVTVVRAENIHDGLPLYLQSKYVLHCKSSTNENSLKQELLKAILEDDGKEDVLGESPFYLN
jgi:hypothetical protein